MSANISDKFNKASNMGGNYPPVATVSSARAASGSTLSCDDLSGWATDTPVHFSTFKVNADGTIDTSTQTDWKGIVIGNTITEMTRLAGAADSGNASGDKVELNPTIGWLDDLITGILVSHKQDGTLKDSIVGTSAISDSAVTSAKLASNAVTTAKINDAAVTSAKIDFTTFGKAKILATSSPNGNYSITDRGVIYGIAEFQVGQYAYDVWGQLSISGNSGLSVAPKAFQYQPYVKGQAHIFAMVDAGDTITISKTIEGGGGSWSDRGFLVFIPCNW